ncbi:unnamed protein product [Mytilus coruscus]|uniref:Uncharacterized protein n=1 Tax=Mytilus coruscus TaxID=42192 RepID=A0A6J8F241_MYTCO|nr:unnamed protein product [Mytilus coruscus]
MTKTDTQSHCEEKIRFLQSKSTNKEVLPLPDKMLPTNIIQHESLPKATERKGKRPAPNPSVYDFPKEYRPSPDTELVPSDMSANQCCRTSFTLKEVFAERNIGNSPDIDCPEQLTREIGRRLRLCLMGPRTFKSIPCTIDLTNDKLKSDVTETRTTAIYQKSCSEVCV